MTQEPGLATKPRARVRRRLGWIVAAAVISGAVVAGVVLLVVLFKTTGDPLGESSGGAGHFPNILSWAEPAPWSQDGTKYLGYAGATADELNRRHAGREFSSRLRYVAADQPARNHFEASVNPIDAYTWSATSRSSNGRCYAVLASTDRNNPMYGDTRYGLLPTGSPCEARYATVQTVRDPEPPN